jgi:hypothetical protein
VLAELKAANKVTGTKATESTYAYSFSLFFKTTKLTQGKRLNDVPNLRIAQ